MKPNSHNKLPKPYWNGVLTIMGDESIDWTMFNLSPYFYHENGSYPYTDIFSDYGLLRFTNDVIAESIN